MNYSHCLRYLNSFLNLEQAGRPHSRVWNLKRMRELLRLFGHPERDLFAVVIGGTKGKGSTGYFLSEILRQSGLRVGFYHSPHLEGPRERIWMDGKPVSPADFAEGLLKIRKRLRRPVIARSPKGDPSPVIASPPKGGRSNLWGSGQAPQSQGPEIASASSGTLPRNDTRISPFTYFEILTLLATLLFKEKQVEVAVFEAGLGGRLDATHVFPAKLVILTPIHFDHEAYLGHTLPKIAREKAALLVRNREVVVAPQRPEVLRVIEGIAKKRHCRILAPRLANGLRPRLLGDFQKLNASVAIQAASILRKRHLFPVTEEALQKGIRSNHWPGRMELFKGRPSFLLDGAHNPQSIEALTRNVKRLFPRRRKILIFGTSRDKRADRMIPMLASAFPICILTRSQTPRAKEIDSLLTEARDRFEILIPSPSVPDALELAKDLAEPEDLIVATGSFYLIGEIRALLHGR